MARSLNKATLIGNVGANPEMRYTQSGAVIATLSLATSTVWRDRNTGQQQERTEWHRITVFGKLAEIVQTLVKKGSKIYIEGKIQTRKWQTPDGQDRYTTEIIVDAYAGQLLLLDSNNKSESSSYNMPYNNYSSGHYGMNEKQSSQSQQNSGYRNFNDNQQQQLGNNASESLDTKSNRDSINNMSQMPKLPVTDGLTASAPSPKQQINQFDHFEDEVPF